MAGLEMALFLALAAAGAALAWRSGARFSRLLVALGALIAVAWGATVTSAWPRHDRAQSPVALEPQSSGSVGSGACRSCHPSEHASWHRSFHRTMTQVATPEAVAGPWDGVRRSGE